MQTEMEKIRESVLEFARDHLQKIRHVSGSVLYSGYETLNAGNVYLLGINPGGCPEHRKEDTIGKHLQSRDSNHNPNHNCYWDEKWNSKHRKPSYSPLQKRVHWLLCKLNGGNCNGESDACIGKRVCASNLIFPRSGSVEKLKPELSKLGMNEKEAADLCWGVHHQIISCIVRPSMILAFGGWPYHYLRARFCETDGKENPEESCHARYGNWKCRRFMTTMEFGGVNREVWIVGIPHLSYYPINIKRDDITDWIKEKLPTTDG